MNVDEQQMWNSAMIAVQGVWTEFVALFSLQRKH